VKEYANRFTRYMGGRVHHMFDGFTRDLTEHRILLNWVYAFAYLALIFFCVQDNQNSQNTAIVTTGGIVGSIFTAYVLGSSYEKVQKMRSADIRSSASEMSADDQEKAAGD
jgi:hypothetical protein